MLMVERSRQSARILHEADCDEYGERDEEDEVKDEENLPNRFKTLKAIGLLREENRNRTGAHCTLKPGPGKVCDTLAKANFALLTAIFTVSLRRAIEWALIHNGVGKRSPDIWVISKTCSTMVQSMKAGLG